MHGGFWGRRAPSSKSPRSRGFRRLGMLLIRRGLHLCKHGAPHDPSPPFPDEGTSSAARVEERAPASVQLATDPSTNQCAAVCPHFDPESLSLSVAVSAGKAKTTV
eukprot:scaffold6010_cov121-Isochrysis_galbana.AAC.3